MAKKKRKKSLKQLKKEVARIERENLEGLRFAKAELDARKYLAKKRKKWWR